MTGEKWGLSRKSGSCFRPSVIRIKAAIHFRPSSVDPSLVILSLLFLSCGLECWLSSQSYSRPSWVDQADAPRGRSSTHLVSMTMWVGLGSKEVNLTLAAAVRRARREQSGGAVIDLFDHEHAHDFGEAELDRVWVFERGDSDDAGLKKLQVNFPTPDDALLVEVATSFVAQGGRSALVCRAEPHFLLSHNSSVAST